MMIYKALEKTALHFPHEWLPESLGRSFAPSSVAGSIYRATPPALYLTMGG